MTGPIIVSPRIAASALERGFARGIVFSRNTGMGTPKPSSSAGLVLYFRPADTQYQNDASSRTLVNRNDSDSDSKSE